MKVPANIFSAIHDPLWVNRQSRQLARELGLVTRTWFKSEEFSWLVLQTKGSPQPNQRRVYLSAGIHGDEAGSVLGLLTWLAQAKPWLSQFHFTILPCLNPWGLRSNSRLDDEQRDLNRSYLNVNVPSTVAHRSLLAKHPPFDLAILLHEDYDAQGMYLYEVFSETESWGHALLRAARSAVPSDNRLRIEGRRADRGVMHRNLNFKNWQKRFKSFGLPEAVYLYLYHCPRVYTLETPSEFDLHQRARAHLLAINEALKKLSRIRGPIPSVEKPL